MNKDEARLDRANSYARISVRHVLAMRSLSPRMRIVWKKVQHLTEGAKWDESHTYRLIGCAYEPNMNSEGILHLEARVDLAGVQGTLPSEVLIRHKLSTERVCKQNTFTYEEAQ